MTKPIATFSMAQLVIYVNQRMGNNFYITFLCYELFELVQEWCTHD
jgi:hypothetical protein